ncbi:MAG: sulfurtransferase [Balneolaceae bacterium]
MRYFILFFTLMLFQTGCSPEATDEPVGYPNSHLLLAADELSELMQTDDILLVDTREAITNEVIPGAVHFPSVRMLTDPDHPVSNFLVGPEKFVEMMRSLGLNNEDRIVIYDDGNALAAARLFYALDYYGFSNAFILNGGVKAWLAEGLPVSDSFAETEQGNFQFEIQENRFCDINYIMEAVNDPDKIIFDVRSEGEYTGEVKRAERSGHIPNAVNLEWNNVLQDGDIPYFKPAQEIQELFAFKGITPEKEIIPHCQTNVRGSHAYFTLRLMGYDSVRPYEGSWAEYGNREDTIVE